jgi:uncharacterized protein
MVDPPVSLTQSSRTAGSSLMQQRKTYARCATLFYITHDGFAVYSTLHSFHRRNCSMKRRELLVGGAAATLSLGLSRFLKAADGNATKRKILFFTKSSGFEHSVIAKKGGAPSHAEKILTELGAKNNFEITHTKDGSIFTAEKIKDFDAFFFYTTGDLTSAGKDGNPPMTTAGKAAFLDAIAQGKGFIGTHSATDTFHVSANDADRYKNFGDKADPYVQMIGAEFIHHGAQQSAKMVCCDPKFPGFDDLKEGISLQEEWYSLKDFAKNLHVLLVQETKGMNGLLYLRPPYPATWARMHDKGRVFYTSMGHREDVWTNPIYQKMLVGALNWVTGNVDADVTPNIETVTPKALELPTPAPAKPK